MSTSIELTVNQGASLSDSRISPITGKTCDRAERSLLESRSTHMDCHTLCIAGNPEFDASFAS